MRISFSIAEEIMERLDRPTAPQTVHVELRVSGGLEEMALRSAVEKALRAHPMTRAQKAVRRVLLRPPLWEVGDDVAGDVVATSECDRDRTMERIRNEFYSRPIDLGNAPAIRVLLVRRSSGDSLLLSLHHAISDGMGAVRFLRTLASNYAGRPEVRPLSAGAEIRARDLRSVWQSTAKRSPTTAHPNRPSEPPATLAGRQPSGSSGYGFVQRSIPAELMRSVRLRDPASPATVNDLLLVALHRTIERWNEDGGRPSRWIAVMMPVNFRPPQWRNEVVANMTMCGRINSSHEQRAGGEVLHQSVIAQTRWLKAGGGTTTLLKLPGWAIWPLLRGLGSLPLPRLRERLRFTTVLSNLGVLDDVDFGPTSGELTEFWFSPPVTEDLGLVVGAVGLKGRVALSFRYHRAAFDEAAVQRLASLYEEMLGADRSIEVERRAGWHPAVTCSETNPLWEGSRR